MSVQSERRELWRCGSDHRLTRDEDAVATRWGWTKIPDAVLCDAAGRPVRAVDFGGAYRDERLRDFHAACAEKSLPYELW